MTLVRLLDDPGSAELRALLENAPVAPPIPRETHERLQNYALGLSAGLTTVGLGVGTAQASLLGKTLSAVLAAPLAAKLALGTALVAATTSFGYVVSGPLVTPSHDARPKTTMVAAPVTAPRAAIVSEGARAASPSHVVAEPLTPPARNPAQPNTHPVEPNPALGVADEARMLEAARASLVSGPALALAITEEHKARFPQAQLAAEREFIAIDALLRLERTEQARRLAEPRLRQAPDSLYARRLRQLLGDDK